MDHIENQMIAILHPRTSMKYNEKFCFHQFWSSFHYTKKSLLWLKLLLRSKNLSRTGNTNYFYSLLDCPKFFLWQGDTEIFSRLSSQKGSKIVFEGVFWINKWRAQSLAIERSFLLKTWRLRYNFFPLPGNSVLPNCYTCTSFSSV